MTYSNRYTMNPQCKFCLYIYPQQLNNTFCCILKQCNDPLPRYSRLKMLNCLCVCVDAFSLKCQSEGLNVTIYIKEQWCNVA